MDKKGFTLIELIIVVAVIGILAMVAVPAYVGQQKRAARAEAYSNLQNLRLLEEQFYAENGDYSQTVGDTGADKDNITSIQAVTGFSGFKPGSNLSFSYQIIHDQRINTPVAVPPTYSAATPCFIARATGNTGSRVRGDVFAIDCDNNKNF